MSSEPAGSWRTGMFWEMKILDNSCSRLLWQLRDLILGAQLRAPPNPLLSPPAPPVCISFPTWALLHPTGALGALIPCSTSRWDHLDRGRSTRATQSIPSEFPNLSQIRESVPASLHWRLLRKIGNYLLSARSPFPGSYDSGLIPFIAPRC